MRNLGEYIPERAAREIKRNVPGTFVGDAFEYDTARPDVLPVWNDFYARFQDSGTIITVTIDRKNGGNISDLAERLPYICRVHKTNRHVIKEISFEQNKTEITARIELVNLVASNDRIYRAVKSSFLRPLLIASGASKDN